MRKSVATSIRTVPKPRATAQARASRTVLSLVAAAFVLVALSGCRVDYPASVLDPAGPAARLELHLLVLSLYVGGGIMIAVFLVLGYVLIRFRARKGDNTEGADNPGVTWLEVTWTVVPAVLLAILAVPSLTGAFHLAAAPPAALKMTVVGHQFFWEFRYDDLGIVTADEPHVPAGRALSLHVTSADVVHSFWVPRLGGKVDAIPGRNDFLYLQSDEVGVFPGVCSQLCGASHAHMQMTIYADTPADFAAWQKAMTKPFVPPTAGTEAAAGMEVFAAKCATCHTIAGTDYKGTMGPSLTGLMLRKTIGAGVAENTHANLVKWVSDASTFKPGVRMPSGKGQLGLNDQQIEQVVAFLETLK